MDDPMFGLMRLACKKFCAVEYAAGGQLSDKTAQPPKECRAPGLRVNYQHHFAIVNC